jgi:hypothetical protein
MAKKDDFFEGEEPIEEPKQEESKIKLGDREFTQDELSGLVGLGEKAKELEDKWNTKIDRLYPEYTKKTQQVSELESQFKALEEEKKRIEDERLQEKANSEDKLSPEDQQRLIKQELSKYGVITKDEVNNYIANFMAGKELLSDIDNIIEDARDDGKPRVSREELLGYMEDNGIKNPTSAYKLMFEQELRDWEIKQIGKLKRPGLETEQSSTAGGKTPAPVKVTKQNIQELLAAALEE